MGIEDTAKVEILQAIGRLPHSVNEGISLGYYSKEDGEEIKQSAKELIISLFVTIGFTPEDIDRFWGL